ncbi:MAG: type II secretion system minor pseudopilin GspK [Pseudomonadota bacterium]
MTSRKQQRGAALLIVLLLAATLSFVALSIMERTTLSAARSVNVNARGEALWRALAVETLALAAVDELASDENTRMSLDDPWTREPIELPLDDGEARVAFVDATTCFNINALGTAASTDGTSTAMREFIRLATLVGVSEFEAAALAEAIGDWIDEDTNRRPQGAEDGYYTALPSPYRTGNQPMAAVSELRAIRGVSSDIYAQLKRFLCAYSVIELTAVNVNMLTEFHAPVLAAALGDEVGLQTALDIIAARPPGGYASAQDFLANPQIAGLNPQNTGRFQVKSRFLEARAEIVYDTALVEMTSMIETGGERARVLARRIGAEE